jgi:hypothetical protein
MGGLHVNAKKILSEIVKNYEKVWTGFVWLRI